MVGMPPPLPKARKKSNILIRKEYSYSEIIDDEIKEEEIGLITISKNDLKFSLDILRNLLNKNKDIKIKFLDWDSVIYIDKNLKNSINNICYMIDDGLRISREYIDLTKLVNIKLVIPFNYLMWGINFNNSVDTYCFQYKNTQGNYLNFTSANGNEKLLREDLEKIRKKIEELKSIGSLSEADNVLLISDFIQSNTQYVSGTESETSRGIFVTPDFPEYIIQRKKSGLVENVFNERNGLCMGIANLSTLLLNNPEFNMEVESLMGCSHVWNKVLIDGQYYYFDNTWNITRSDTLCEDGLVTLSFSNKYNLFGNKTALKIGHHVVESTPVYNNGILSEEDYMFLQYVSKFEYPSKPFYKSFRK